MPSNERPVLIKFGDFELTLTHDLDAEDGCHVDLLNIKTGSRPPMEKQTVRLLLFFVADNEPGITFSLEDLRKALWPDSNPNQIRMVHGQLYKLRFALGDGHKCEIVQNSPGGGYKFAARVTRDDGFTRLSGFCRWDFAAFHKYMSSAPMEHPTDVELDLERDERLTPDDQGHVRIVTTRALWSISESPLRNWLGRRLHLRIVLIDFTDLKLMEARFGLLTNPGTVRDQIVEQIDQFKKLRHEYGSQSIKWRFTHAITFGPLFHASNWALLGTFPAKVLYNDGPMIVAYKNANLPFWRMLYDEWRIRWVNPVVPPLQRPKTGDWLGDWLCEPLPANGGPEQQKR